MKKRFSTLTVVIIGFLMMAVGVGASSYYHWAGSENFDSSMNTIDKVQYGISLLMSDLETEKTNHAGTQTELNNTKAELENLRSQLDLEDGQDSKEALENLIAERDTLQEDINSIVTTTNEYVEEINGVNGKGPKYDKLFELLTEEKLNTLYDYSDSDIVGTERNYLDKDPGNGPKDNQLEQAIKDMEDVKNKSEDTLKVFDEETRNRIEDAHEYEEYVPEEEEETDTGE